MTAHATGRYNATPCTFSAAGTFDSAMSSPTVSDLRAQHVPQFRRDARQNGARVLPIQDLVDALVDDL